MAQLITTRRGFVTGAAAAAGVIFSPPVVSAQHLSGNDIWSKQPKARLKAALALCLDKSGSMKPFEMEEQRTGHMAAFNDSFNRSIITEPDRDGNAGIAVCMISFNNSVRYHSPHTHTMASNCWAYLETDADIDQFIAFIESNAPLTSNNGTNTCASLKLATDAHNAFAYETLRKTCDVSTDGPYGNDSTAEDLPEKAEELKAYIHILAVQYGITVNAFAMMDDQDVPYFIDSDAKTNVVRERGRDYYSGRYILLDHYLKSYGVTQYASVRGTTLSEGRVYKVSKRTGGFGSALTSKLGYDLLG